MSDHKKERKKAQVKKNRFQQEIFNFIRLKRQEEQRVEDLKEQMAPGAASPSGEVWCDKVATIRNRLDGSKRVSKERWNRFSGTGDAGARGR
jgi:hypothetical protein